ncbi:MAG: hypothetical protein Q7J78_01885, partial [Clostridiales bacterium]|nr:hypothetical protein [Clostridiales bacterium]
GKGETIFRHIDDPKGIFDSEDPIENAIKRIEKNSEAFSYQGLLNSRYTEVYNRPLLTPIESVTTGRRFSILYGLVLPARQYFGSHNGVLSLLNHAILL